MDYKIERELLCGLAEKGIYLNSLVYTTAALDKRYNPYMYLVTMDSNSHRKLAELLKSVGDKSGIDCLKGDNDRILRIHGISLILFLKLFNINDKDAGYYEAI